MFTLLLFIPACFALNLAPGPNNLMAMKNAKDLGLKIAILAGLGRLFAFSLMIAIAAFGLAKVLLASQALFMVIKIVGASYLLYIAYRLWLSEESKEQVVELEEKHLVSLAKQEFLLAIGNPKAILIFTAFLPQFIDTSGDVDQQFLLLGVMFLVLEWVAISLYACFGVYLRSLFSQPKMRTLFNKCCASFLGISGLALLLNARS
jgi:threonine/homoserine/homoserine lactone efflux protein